MPDVIVQERMIEIPGELLAPQPCPTVPDHGDIGHLLDWAERCAVAARRANNQLDAIRNLE